MFQEMMRTAPAESVMGVRLFMACPSCGREPPEGNKFCPYCGTKLEGHPGLDMSGWSCSLVREAIPGTRIVPKGVGGAVQSAAEDLESVTCDLPAVAEFVEGSVMEGRDEYVLFDTRGGTPETVKCPLGLKGMCRGSDGKACGDLTGWLCADGPGGRVVCAAVCRANLQREFFSK